MKIKSFVILLSIIVSLGIVGAVLFNSAEPAKTQTTQQYSRIISLAPNITEILYALSLEEKIIGVTRYCKYPPEAMKKKKIGGYLDPNFEEIVAALPELVITFPEQIQPVNHFARLGIKTLTVKHLTIEDILESIMIIGQSCGVPEKAERLIGQLKARIKTIEEQTKNLEKQRVLVCVERNTTAGSFDAVYIAGRDGFYSKMIELAGGVNVYTGRIKFPKVGHEGIIAMNPDVIIDVVSDIESRHLDAEQLREQWGNIPETEAVKKKQVYIFSENYIAIPGPRFILTLEEIAKAIHPEMELMTIE